MASFDDVAPVIEPGGAYSLQALGPGYLGLAGICASSTKNKYFPASQVIDGNTHTAWAPDPCDNCPTLTIDLCGWSCIDSLWLKQSGCATSVDVQVWSHGCWEDAGCNLKPTAAVLSNLAVHGVGTKVKLKFKGCDPRTLLVCDVRICGKTCEEPPIEVVPL